MRLKNTKKLSKNNNFEMPFYKQSDFKELQKQWYKILKKSGFNDIETWKSIQFNWITKHIPPDENDPNVIYRREHFSRCETLLHSGKITDDKDLLILEFYCDGMTNVESATKLNSTGIKIDQSTVKRRLDKMLNAEGIPRVTHNSKW